MNSAKLAQTLPAAQDALRTFLGTLLGQEAPLQLDAPTPTTLEEVRTRTMAYLSVLSKGDPAVAFAVMLDTNWLPLLSQAMLGEAIEPDDAGAEDLIVELAGQAYGSLRNGLADSLTLPEASMEMLPPGSPLPRNVLADELFEVPFTVTLGDRQLGGFALLSAQAPPAEPEPKRQAPQAARAAAAAAAQGAGAQSGSSGRPIDVAPAAFPDLGGEMRRTGDGGGNFDLLAEVELEVTVELGRRRLPLSDLLRLTTGSVIELEKLVGEPLEVYANGRLIAEGEAVVIDEQFGIRITSLASNRQRARAFL